MPAANIPQVVLQYGPEATRGTQQAAVRVVDHTPGSVNWKRDIKVIAIRNAGSYATAHRAYPGQETTEIDFTAPLTYDRGPDFGNLFINTLATGTGTGLTRTWTFTPSDTTDGLKGYTFEYGGTNMPSAYTLNGCVGKSLSISIKPNMPWELKVTVIGLSTASGSLTSALALPSTLAGDDVLWSQTKVYFDTSSAFGTTQQVGRIVSADVTLTNGIDTRYTLDGVNTPYRTALGKERVIEATIVAEYDSQTQYTAAASTTAQRVRIEAINGSKKSTLDINGYWDNIPFGADNGVVTTQMKLRGLYESAVNSSDFKWAFINGVTTLTTIP